MTDFPNDDNGVVCCQTAFGRKPAKAARPVLGTRRPAGNGCNWVETRIAAFLSVRIKCSSQLSERKAFTPAIKSLKGTEQRNRICLSFIEVEKDPGSLSRKNVVRIFV